MKKCFFLVCLSLFSLLTWANPLPAAEIFHVKVNPVDPNTFLIVWQIKEGYFLYADRISLTMKQENYAQIGQLRYPAPEKKLVQQGPSYSIYRKELALSVPILGKEAGKAVVTLHFQGCADKGFCYPPEERLIQLTIDQHLALDKVAFVASNTQDFQEKLFQPKKSASEIEAIFSVHRWWITLLMFLGFGLLLSFTPCVLPMIPVLSGIILGQGKLSTRKAFLLSLGYVLSMACTYALIGAVAALLGNDLQMTMQSPIFVSLLSGIFVLLALAMFGFFELKLPATWQAKLVKTNHPNKGYIQVIVMGCLSTLVLSPCVTPPLIGALGYIANTHNVPLGSLALFFMGFGMGIPLLLLGTSAGKWLPKTGYWMHTVKLFFGFLLLAMAIYLLSRIIPGLFTMVLWSTLLIFSGVYTGALTTASTRYEKFNQSVGILLLAYGLLLLTGASMGNNNPLQPLAGVTKNANTIPQMKHSVVTNVEQLQQELAKANKKPVILDFYADWCVSCKIMETTLFQDPLIDNALQNFFVIKVDITENTPNSQALLRQYHVIAPPTLLFLDQQGDELMAHRLVGEISNHDFLQQLQSIQQEIKLKD